MDGVLDEKTIDSRDLPLYVLCSSCDDRALQSSFTFGNAVHPLQRTKVGRIVSAFGRYVIDLPPVFGYPVSVFVSSYPSSTLILSPHVRVIRAGDPAFFPCCLNHFVTETHIDPQYVLVEDCIYCFSIDRSIDRNGCRGSQW